MAEVCTVWLSIMGFLYKEVVVIIKCLSFLKENTIKCKSVHDSEPETMTRPTYKIYSMMKSSTIHAVVPSDTRQSKKITPAAGKLPWFHVSDQRTHTCTATNQPIKRTVMPCLSVFDKRWFRRYSIHVVGVLWKASEDRHHLWTRKTPMPPTGKQWPTRTILRRWKQ